LKKNGNFVKRIVIQLLLQQIGFVGLPTAKDVLVGITIPKVLPNKYPSYKFSVTQNTHEVAVLEGY